MDDATVARIRKATERLREYVEDAQVTIGPDLCREGRKTLRDAKRQILEIEDALWLAWLSDPVMTL